MIDLDAPLVPGVEAAGIRLGQPIEEILRVVAPDAVEQRIVLRVLKYGPVWVFDQGGAVHQVCVWPGYRGKVAGLIGVGSRVADVEAAFGPVEDLEYDEYEVHTGEEEPPPGWLFGLERGSPKPGTPGWREARVQCICIDSRESIDWTAINWKEVLAQRASAAPAR